jgi:hypothetical protein
MSGSVYFIEADNGRIKIGYAANVAKRFRALQTANSATLTLLGSVAGTRAAERAIHRRLAAHRQDGEWFDDCPPVRECMSLILSAGVEAVWTEIAQAARCPFVTEAAAIADVLWRYFDDHSGGDTASRMARTAIAIGLEANTLWRLRYRPRPNISVDEYYGLAEQAIEAEQRLIERIRSDFAIAHKIIDDRDAALAQVHATEAEIERLRQEVADIRGVDINDLPTFRA